MGQKEKKKKKTVLLCAAVCVTPLNLLVLDQISMLRHSQ